MTGLLVDEWVETVPSPRAAGNLTFHYDQPRARAPNVILLAVPPDLKRPWDLETLETVVLETIELTRIRAVDQDGLRGLGQYLPALFFAMNASDDTAAMDFSRNAAAPSIAQAED